MKKAPGKRHFVNSHITFHAVLPQKTPSTRAPKVATGDAKDGL
jgi:hypothetical protein